MGKWKTWTDGETIPTDDATSYEDLNHWLDYRDYSDDTHASGWGASEKGRLWWNTTDLRYKFWDGSAVQTLPGTVGATNYKLRPTYTIYKSGSTYYAMDEDGNVDDSGSDFPTLFNTAVTTMGSLATGAPGHIHLKQATYSVDADLTMGHKTQLTADPNTVLDVTQNLTSGCIVVDATNLDWTNWSIENLHIDMNQYNGNGVYTNWAGQGSMKCKETLRNISIIDVKAGYSGLHINNPFQMYTEQLRITTYGTGITMREGASSVYTGNSQFNSTVIGLSSDSGVGVDLNLSGGTKRPLSHSIWNRLQVNGTGATSTGYGVKIVDDGAKYLCFTGIDLETNDIDMLLDDAQYITLVGGTMAANNTYGIQFTGDTDYVNVYGTWIKTWRDETDGTKNLNMFGGRMYGTVTRTASSRFRNVPDYVNEAFVEATITNGNASVDISRTTLGLDSTFDFTSTRPLVTCTGQHAEVHTLIWDVKDADEITVTATVGAVTADRKINVYVAMAGAI